MPHRLDKGRGLVDALTCQKSLKVGLEGTDIKQLRRYTPTLTPPAVGANTTSEQTFAVTGLAVGDVVVSVQKPAAQAGLHVAGARVSALDTLAILFGNHTASAITPTAAEVYQVLVWRP